MNQAGSHNVMLTLRCSVEFDCVKVLVKALNHTVW